MVSSRYDIEMFNRWSQLVKKCFNVRVQRLNDQLPEREHLSAGTSGRWGTKAMAVVPLAILSAAWTAHGAGLPGATPLLSAQPPAATAALVPAAADPTPAVTVPSLPVEVPASLSATNEVVTATDGRFVSVADVPSTNDIQAPALAAYQRSETVINAADKTCHLSWQLVAAVGRLESDHGRFGGSSIGPDGVVQPAILGPVLDGTGGTSSISDTDAGQYDGDTRFDRAVGPMQFIPSTWSVVGVDADNDGVRDPQDIDDAALAAAVYLCSGSEDLSTVAGQRASIYRYNHSESYVDLVLSIMNGYLDGDFASVAPATVSAGTIVPVGPLYPVTPGGPYEVAGPTSEDVAVLFEPAVVDHAQVFGPFPESPSLGTTDPDAPLTHPTTGPGPDGGDEVPPGETPTDPPTDTPTDGPSDGPADVPTETPTDPPTDTPTGTPTEGPATGEPSDVPTDPADQGPLTEDPVPSDEALAACTDAGLVDDPDLVDDEFDLCVIAYDDPDGGTAPDGTPVSPASTTPARFEGDQVIG
ncbi:hypothetical protein BH11ACT8_BH11ACT8_24380 [soil metagenome]